MMQDAVNVGGILILLGKAQEKLCKRRRWLEKSGAERSTEHAKA